MKRLLTSIVLLLLAVAGYANCTSCPLTGWDQGISLAVNNNNTPCNPNDDKLPVKVKVFHAYNAHTSTGGQFSVTVGTGSSAITTHHNYNSNSNSTWVTVYLPLSFPNNVAIKIFDPTFGYNCKETGTLCNVNFYPCAVPCSCSDNTPPTIQTPVQPVPPIEAYTSDCNVCTPSSPCGTDVSWIPPTATDNCGPVNVWSNKQPGDFFTLGTHTVTYIFTDNAGNSKSISFQVIVLDGTKPIAKCKAPFTVTIPPSGTITIPVSQVNNNSYDKCGLVTPTISPNTFTCADAGTTKTVTLTVTDAAGNTATCSTQVTINGGSSCAPSCTHTCDITTTPCNTTNIGPVQNSSGAYNMFLGYGPQSMTLHANSSTGGAGCTYSWSAVPGSGTPTNALSSTTSANPVFTPTCAGTYKYKVKISNCNSCNAVSYCYVTICVKDVRYDDGCGYDKVLMCYDPGNCPPSTVAVHPLIAYFFMEYCSDFKLGYCGQSCPTFNGGYRMAAGDEDEIKPANQEAVDKLIEQYGIGKLMADKAFDMVVFPNPTKTDFRLRVQSVLGEKAEVRVFDVTGRIVERASIKTNVDEVVGRNLAPGAYIIEVSHGGHVKKTRAVKQ